MMLTLSPAGNTSQHPADGTRGEAFPGRPCTELLSEEMEREFHTPSATSEAGREQLMAMAQASCPPGSSPPWL